jgi:glutamyl-tRNA synthetase
LEWLGIPPNEGPIQGGSYGPYRQTERREIYGKYAWELVEKGSAFPCFCTPERLEKVRQEQLARKENPRYDGTCRNLDPEEVHRRISASEKYVIRFKMPKEGSTTAVDLLRGSIAVANTALDDSVLIKSDGLPTYHMGAMIDDHLMEITHVNRGSEWSPSLHVNILRLWLMSQSGCIFGVRQAWQGR